MSATFSDTTNYSGLVQLFEKEIGANYGDVSGNTTKLKTFTAGVNSALDDFFAIAIQASGTWQLDDSNQTDYPIIYTNLVAGQRDYTFTTDGSGNLILDIYKVMALGSATGTIYNELYPADQQQTEPGVEGFTNGQNIGGVPMRYDKTGNSLFLDAIPSYSVSNGLKVYVNREASYFTSTDTTKKPGVPGLLHDYFYLKPALDHARRNSLVSHDRIALQVSNMEKTIKEYFGRREKDERNLLTMKSINFR